MKKIPVTLAALLLTFLAGIALLTGRSPASRQEEGLQTLRIWIAEEEPAVGRWLKKMAARYEKETGVRVYLRTASREEADAARWGQEEGPLPDLLIMQGLEAPLLCRGYALFVRDDSASPLTPAPTSALFYRPTASPGPTPSPAPDPDLSSLSGIAAPAVLCHALPGCAAAANPLSDFLSGKASAALLTAGQAAQIPFGYRAYPLPEGGGMLPVKGQAITEAGRKMLFFLQQESAQRALSDFGLYAGFSSIRLYTANDPLRMMIESSQK